MKEEIRQAVEAMAISAESFDEFQTDLKEYHNIHIKVRGIDLLACTR